MVKPQDDLTNLKFSLNNSPEQPSSLKHLSEQLFHEAKDDLVLNELESSLNRRSEDTAHLQELHSLLKI